MPFLIYIVVILVALSSVLIELDWLTRPKLDPKAKVQQTASVTAPAPPAKVDGPNVVLSPVYPSKSNEAQPAQAAAAPPADTTSASMQPAIAPATAASAPPAPAASPQTAAIAAPVPSFDTSAKTETKPVEAKAVETTGSGNAAETKVATAPTQPIQTEQSAPVPTAKPASAAVQPATLRTTNRCDVQACSGMYQSFRAADCTYQPMEGPRKLCAALSSGGSAQKAAPEPRQRNADSGARRASDKPMNLRSKDAELREVERTVKRITAGEASAEVDDGGGYGGRVIVIRRSPRW